MAPFIIYALPRSRTAWLAKFLTYGEWTCYHEQAIYMTNMEDVKALFECPNIGMAETAAAQGRYLIRHVVPDIREVVILRPVEEVVESMMAVDISGLATYDKTALRKGMEYSDRVLQKISKDPNVLTVNYCDLDKPEVCARIFEHCLPYVFDRDWWESMKDKNIQADVRAVIRYYYKYKETIEAFKRHCKSEILRLHRLNRSILRTS